MRRLADHAGKLAAMVRDSPDDRLTHSAVRQVHFNAWHYTETDLWASLVTELFSQMAAGPGDAGVEERRQSRLAAELAARRQLPERLRAAQDRQQALRQELELADRQWTLPLRLGPQEQARLVGLAADQPERVYQTMREAASLSRADMPGISAEPNSCAARQPPSTQRPAMGWPGSWSRALGGAMGMAMPAPGRISSGIAAAICSCSPQ